jgi:polar amino acid transport system substrate-binding protein
MQTLVRHLFLVVALFLGSMSSVKSAEKLTLRMTEISGQTMLNEEEPGAALEIIRTLVGRTNMVLDEQFMPWTRAVKLTTTSTNSVIVPFSRTPSREDKFVWISELYELQFGFVSVDQAVDDKTSARLLGKIGVWRGTAMEEELKRDGFKNLTPVSNDQTLARMLVHGRFDAWYGSLNEAAYKFRGIDNVNHKSIKIGAPVNAFPVWLAGGPDLDEKVADKLRKNIEIMRDDGTVAVILERYGMAGFE